MQAALADHPLAKFLKALCCALEAGHGPAVQPIGTAPATQSFTQWCAVRLVGAELLKRAGQVADHAIKTQESARVLVRADTSTSQQCCGCGGFSRISQIHDCDCMQSKIAEFCCDFLMLRTQFMGLEELSTQLCSNALGDFDTLLKQTGRSAIPMLRGFGSEQAQRVEMPGPSAQPDPPARFPSSVTTGAGTGDPVVAAMVERAKAKLRDVRIDRRLVEALRDRSAG